MIITTILYLVVFLSLLLGYLSILQDRKSFNNIFFSLFCFLAAVWTFTNAMTGVFPTAFWLKSTYSFGALIMPTGMIWTFILVDKHLSLRKFIIPYLFGLFFFVASFFDGFIAKNYGVIYPGGTFTGDTASGLILYTVFFVILAIIIIYKLIFGYKHTGNKEEKLRLKYILYGCSASISISLLTSFLFPILNIYQFSGLDSVGFIIFLLCISYAVIKYDLLDIKVVATEIFIFVLWIFLIIRITLSNNYQDFIINSILFIAVVVIGILLIRGALKERKQKEELVVFNTQLEQKVAEQTVEIRRAYEVEKKARQELEELDSAKDQFILTTQHHLRTPITIIKGYLQSVLAGKSEPLGGTTRTYLTKAEEATERVAVLVNEFLDISQMEVGKSILKKEPTNLRTIIEDILDELSPELTKKHLQTSITFPPKEEDNILSIDKEKIKEGLVNLIDNSIKYNKEGGEIRIKGEKIHHSIERDKEIYRITIEDTGIGLTPEELPKLFTQYFQRGKEAEKLYTTGRGIGLTITKNIIQAHQGRIYAESEGRNKGSKFTIELPLI